MWAASSELHFAASLHSDAGGFDQRGNLFGEENWCEGNADDASGRVFRAQANAVRLIPSRDLCATWSHVTRLPATDSMNSRIVRDSCAPVWLCLGGLTAS